MTFIKPSVAITAMVLGLSGTAIAEQPDRTVEIIAGASPGGGYDLAARAIQRVLDSNDLVTEPITVVNRPGGGGSVGWAYINRFQGDLHYLSMTATAFLANELTGASPLSFEDFTPVATLVTEDLCFAVNPSGRFQTAEDLVAAMQDDPSSIRFAFSTAIGNQNHVALALLADAVGADVREIRTAVFGGASEAVVALLGDNADLSISGVASYAGYQESGELQCVAISSAERLGGVMADVPTWSELGVDLVYSPFRGVVAPGGLNDEQTAFWEDTLRAMSETEEWQQIAADNNWTINFLGYEETMAFLDEERDRLRDAFASLGIVD